MKIKIQIIVLLLCCFLGFGSNQVFEIISDEPVTPLSLLIIPVFDIPEAVHSIYAEIKLLSTSANKSLSEQIITFHSAYYPILINTDGQAFSILHFTWMIEPEQYSDAAGMGVKAEDCKVSVQYSFDQPLKSYTKLLNVMPESENDKRKVIKRINGDSPEEKFKNTDNGNQKAIVFVHGLLRGGYDTILRNFEGSLESGWHNDYLKEYWKNYYDFDDTDYYEFHYDSYFNSAKYYGEELNAMLCSSGILDQYEEVYIISYSMGTIVSRYAANTKLKDSDVYLGEKIKQVLLIGGVLEGSFFTNLVDHVLTNLPVHTAPLLINTHKNQSDDIYLYKILDLIYNLEDFIFEADGIVEFFENFMRLYELNPTMATVLFISFSDIPFIGGQVIPYEGMNSLKYTSEEFLRNLEKSFNFSEGVYIDNRELLTLNEIERFKDKYVFITSYIGNAGSSLQKFMNFSKNISLQSIFDNISDQNTDFLSIPFVQFMGQRVLSMVLQEMGDLAGDGVLHSQNDGFVTLWSQQLTGHNSGIDPNDVYLLKNLDHAQIKDDQEALKIIKKIVNQ